MAHLIVYFVPAFGLADTLAPAAILTTTVIIMLASTFKAVFLAGINSTSNNTSANQLAKLVLGAPNGNAKHQLGLWMGCSLLDIT